MIYTSAFILLPLAILVKNLRNGFYFLHILLVVSASFLTENQLSTLNAFSPAALMMFLIIHLISINLVTFIAYAFDKNRAARGGWRIPERTLQSFALLGGTPSAFIAQKLLKHKTSKKAFKDFFWLVFILQIVVIIGFLVILAEG